MEDSTMIALTLFGISTVANAATLATVYDLGTRIAVIEALFKEMKNKCQPKS